MKTAIAFVGAIVSAGIIVAVNFLVGLGWLGVGITLGSVIVCYIVAALTAASSFGEFMRGLLIGVNAGLNFVLGMMLFRIVFSPDVTLILSIIVASLNFLAVLGPVSNNGFYQGVLGWANWLLPMSWLIVALGAIFFVLNLVGHVIYWISKSDFFRVTGMDADFKTGTFFTRGGWISNLNYLDTAFNMGNFSYVDNKAGSMHIEHEAGHTLNLGAFGSVFHLVGAIDENVTGGGRNAFSERLAESNDPATTQANIIPMWI